MTQPNVALLRKTLEHIEAHPDEWDQKWWAARTKCGTTFCFAGWTVALGSSTEVAWQYGYAVCTATGELISDVARDLLGLDDNQADRLFGGSNTLADIRRTVEDIIGEPL